MPELKIDDDPATYRVETPKGFVSLNALELSSAIVAAGATEENATPEQLIAAVEEISEPKEVLAELTNHQKFAVGATVAKQTDEEIATGLVAGLSSTRANRILDSMVAIGTALSPDSDARPLMRAAGLSDKEIVAGEVKSWLASGKSRSLGKVGAHGR
jgi:hypothetical protein